MVIVDGFKNADTHPREKVGAARTRKVTRMIVPSYLLDGKSKRHDLEAEARADAALVARHPHLARPGPNWRAQARRASGLPPELTPGEVDALAALVAENGEVLVAALWPALEGRVRGLIAGV